MVFPIGGGNIANYIPPGPPAGGQGTKPGSSKDDTARKITNPPRQSEIPPLKYPKRSWKFYSRSN